MDDNCRLQKYIFLYIIFYDDICLSVCLFVCLFDSHILFTMFLALYQHDIFRSNYHWHNDVQGKVKVRGKKLRVTDVKTTIAPDRAVQFEFIYGHKIMHKTLSGIEEVPFCFSRSSVKFQGHMGWKID